MAQGEIIVVNNGYGVAPDESYYILVCCDTNLPLKVNGEPVALVYDGRYNKGLDPEKIISKKMSSFTTINEVVIEGCYRLEEIECTDGYEIYNYSLFLLKAVFDLNPKKKKPAVTQNVGRVVYATEVLPNSVDPSKAKKVMCAFATAMNQRMMSDRFGISFCCPQELESAEISFNILKLDLVDSSKIDCPTC